MKKILLLTALMGVSTYSYTNSGGSPTGRSGSPGDNGQTCTSSYCHSGGAPTGNEFIGMVTSSDSLSDGNTMGITLGINTGGTSTRVGFMACVEDAIGNKLTPSNPGSGAKKVGNYITHNLQGTTTTNDSAYWTFDHSDSNYPDSVTIYAAVNFSNSNGTTSRDVIVTASKTIYKQNASIGLNENAQTPLSISPNPATDYLRVDSDGIKEVRLYNTTGRFMQMDFQQSLIGGNRLDVSTLPRGPYILHAEYLDGTVRYKHVVLQ